MKYFFEKFFLNNSITENSKIENITPTLKNILIKIFYYLIIVLIFYFVIKIFIIYSFMLLEFFIHQFKIFDIFKSRYFSTDTLHVVKNYFIFINKIYFIFYYFYLLQKHLWVRVYLNDHYMYIINNYIFSKNSLYIFKKNIISIKINQNLFQKIFSLYNIEISAGEKIIISNIFLNIQKFNDFLKK